jgi:hypothetical protein
MAVYFISYDLKEAEWDDYTDLHKEIKKFGDAIQILESTFIVDTSLSAQVMSDRITAVYKPQKHLVHKLIPGSDRQGVLKKSHWEWLKAHL